MASSVTPPDKQQRLLQLIECPVCLNELKDPRMLSCRHTLCYKCVKDYTEKNKYDKELPCPVCREVTTLFAGGVDNLPKFFFMNELKEVVMEEDGVKDYKPQKHNGTFCSLPTCQELAVKFCKQGCDFLCQSCYDEHCVSRFTQSHQVIEVGEAEAFAKDNTIPYPPCHRHKHQVMDLYCRTCNIPICTTCCQVNHQGHDCVEIDNEADVCKLKLEDINKATDRLIDVVKQAIDKTKVQIEQAEVDIDGMNHNVKSAFKKMHDDLDEEEKKMLSDLEAARRRVKKTSDVISDSQIITQASLESLRSCQVKLAEKDSAYDYVTFTDSIIKDVESYYSKELASFTWSSHIDDKCESGYSRQIKVTESEVPDRIVEVKEVRKTRLPDKEKQSVSGMVFYRNNIYVLRKGGLAVHCYSSNGPFLCTYEDKARAANTTQGMCLMMDGDTAKLVVCDFTGKTLIWITINDDFAMNHLQTKQLNYRPCGVYNDGSNLLVSSPVNREIHCYTGDGQKLSVITLPGDVKSYLITRHGDQYVVTDWESHQVVMIDEKGLVQKRYKDDMHGVKLDAPYNVICDRKGRILISDFQQHRVLSLSRDGVEVRQLIQKQHLMHPWSLCLDPDNNQLYVSGLDNNGTYCVFVYDYKLLMGNKTFTNKITNLKVNVKL